LGLERTVIRDNEARDLGGGIENYGRLSILESRIEENRLVHNAPARGGGIHTQGPVLIRKSAVRGNSIESLAEAYGGGIYARNTEVVILSSSVAGNRADVGPGGFLAQGGGIRANNTALRIEDSSITENRVGQGNGARRGAGVFHGPNGDLEMYNTILLGNVVEGRGEGALFTVGEATLHHLTIVGNVSGAAYPGVGFGGDASIRVLNSVIAGNAGSNESEDLPPDLGVPSGPAYTFTGNLIGTVDLIGVPEAVLDGNLLGVAPGGLSDLGFSPAPDFGFVRTYEVDAGSPVNAGSADECLSTDLIGTSRPQGFTCDGGAIEHIPPPIDTEGPVVTALQVPLDPLPVGSAIEISAVADDSGTGGSAIESLEATFDGSTWIALPPSDGTFDSPVEEAVSTFDAPDAPAVIDVCVRATDSAGNTGPESCATVVVYDPSGGFVGADGSNRPRAPIPGSRTPQAGRPSDSSRVTAGVRTCPRARRSSSSGPPDGASSRPTTSGW
jgi:hypothetical protein